MTKILAVDIAGFADWTALMGVEAHGDPPRRYRVPLLERWHEKYATTVDRVAAVAETPAWIGATVAVDATGVGRPVLETLRERLGGRVVGITFTAGSAVTEGATWGDLRVPKKDLVGAAQLLFQTGRVKINPDLPHARTLADELVAYTVKVTPHMNETFDVGREGVNDDLVCALAMAAWLGERDATPASVNPYGGDRAALAEYQATFGNMNSIPR